MLQARHQARLTQPALADRLRSSRRQQGRVAGGTCHRRRTALAVVGESCPHLQRSQGLSGFAAASWRCSSAAGAGRGGAGAVSLLRDRPASIASAAAALSGRINTTTKQAPGCLLCCLSGRGAFVPARRFPVGSNWLMGFLTGKVLHHRCLVGRLSCPGR